MPPSPAKQAGCAVRRPLPRCAFPWVAPDGQAWCNRTMRVLPPRAVAVLFRSQIAALALLCATTVPAQQPPLPVEQAARQLLEREAAGLPGDVSIAVEPFQADNRLPACTGLEAFLPAGARAWGRLSVGVRCSAPIAWTVFVPARVAVIGEYLVTARPIRAGQIIGSADLIRQSADLTTLPEDTLRDESRATGKHTRFAVAAGTPLRAGMLRLPPVVQQGQNVRVISGGEGFRVSNEGRALNRAAEGEAVRVRLPGGQVVQGTARFDGAVEILP